MKNRRPCIFVLLILAFAAGPLAAGAADSPDFDQPRALDAREEQLMGTASEEQLAALLRGEPQPLPRDPAEGLLFYPVEPCRLVDGLNLSDPAQAASTRLFVAGGCGVRPLEGKLFSFSAASSALVRVELHDARGSGSIVLWRPGAPQPSSGLLDYSPGRPSIGTVIVPVCAEVGLDPCATGDISFAADGDAVLATIDLLGYFAPRQQPAAPATTSDETVDGPAALAPKSLASPFWESGVAAGSIFYSDGKVGIGTSDPLAPLEVWGPATPYPGAKAARFMIRGESASFRDQITITSDSAEASNTGYGIAFAGLGHHRAGIYTRDIGGSASSKGELNLWARSSGNIVLTAGAIGAGVADPTAKLHVGGDLKLNLGEGLLFNQNTSYWGTGLDARLIQILDSNGAKGNADGGLIVESRTTSDDHRRPIVTLRHDSGYPRLGIGNVFPAGLLEVHSRRQTGGGSLTSVGTAVTGDGTAFTSQLVVGSELLVGQQIRRVAAIASDHELTVNVAFPTDLVAAAFTYQQPALLLNPEGKLGLGTGATALTERLEVIGNLKLSGNLLAGGDLCIGSCP